jgi:hypothetical protein
MRRLMAGAAGTTALNAVTYADMALRGPATDTPERAVASVAQRLGQDAPGGVPVHEHRVSGLAHSPASPPGWQPGRCSEHWLRLFGTSRSGLRRSQWEPRRLAGSDVPMTRLGLTDVGDWSPADWATPSRTSPTAPWWHGTSAPFDKRNDRRRDVGRATWATRAQ